MKKLTARKSLFINRSAQRKFLLVLSVSMVLPALFVGGALYYLIFTLAAEQLGVPESIACNLFPVIEKINLILLVGIPPLFTLLILWGMILSHRFAGPLLRLEREIRDMASRGDFGRRLRVRKNDDLRPIADAVNTLLDKAEGKLR